LEIKFKTLSKPNHTSDNLIVFLILLYETLVQ